MDTLDINTSGAGNSDIDEFIAEFDADNKKGQREYRKMLRRLCPSEDMRKQARRLSRKFTCGKCAYNNSEKQKCENPHRNMYNMFIDIDHCYEGILRNLVAEREKTLETEANGKDELIAGLSEALESSLNIASDSMEITRGFARWIIMMADGNWKMPLSAVKCVRETLDMLNEILAPPDEDGF